MGNSEKSHKEKDVTEVHSVLQNELDDFDRFVEYVVDYLQQRGI